MRTRPWKILVCYSISTSLATLMSRLSWKKCYGILIRLAHVRHCIPPDLLPQLVNALVISHVRYCLTVFGNGSQLNMDRLDKILNFAMRVISGKRKFEHITPVRTELGWPTASQMYRQQSLNSLHKIRCTGEPQALASQLVLNSQTRSRLTRQDPDLSLPRVNTDFFFPLSDAS